MTAFEAWLVFLILVVNVVGELQRKRTLAASRGFLAAARLSCTCIQSPFSQTRTKPDPDPKPGFCGLPNPKPGFSKKASGLESLVSLSPEAETVPWGGLNW